MLYLVAGKGPYLDEIKKYVRMLKLESNVMFLGWITEPEKSLVLQNSDLFIMTPTKVGESVEGFGMVFIDAAFHGIASIGTLSGGISDAVIDNKTGLLCEEGNQESITKSIDKLLYVFVYMASNPRTVLLYIFFYHHLKFFSHQTKLVRPYPCYS